MIIEPSICGRLFMSLFNGRGRKLDADTKKAKTVNKKIKKNNNDV